MNTVSPMNDRDRPHPENWVINDPNAGHHCTPTKYETRRIHLHELPLITITCFNKKTGGMFHERHNLDQLPDTESGVPMYTMTKEGGGRVTVMMGQYPSCSCESHNRNRAVYCKHLIAMMKIQELKEAERRELDKGIDEDRGQWQADQAEASDFTRAESEDWQ